MLVLGLFGHHRAGLSWIGRLTASLHGVPISIWVAVIGVLAAVLTPLVNHVLTKRREEAAAARDELRRREERARTRAHVRADVLLRLRSHHAALEASARRGGIDADLWQAAHDALARRVRDSEVIDALGPAYADFMRAVHAEHVAINVQRRTNSQLESAENAREVLAAYGRVAAELDRTGLQNASGLRRPQVGR